MYVDFLATVSEETTGFGTLDQVAELEELIKGHDAVLKQYMAKAANKSINDAENKNIAKLQEECQFYGRPL